MSGRCRVKLSLRQAIPIDRETGRLGFPRHPDKRNVGERSGLIAASDIGVRACEPHLLDGRASRGGACPIGRDEVVAMFVDRQGLDGRLHDGARARVVKRELLLVGIREKGTWNAEAADRVPHAYEFDRHAVVHLGLVSVCEILRRMRLGGAVVRPGIG